MEGGGEGMVAVVQGTKHALTVTLISGDRGNPTTNFFNENKKSTRVSLSSVETNTERNIGNVNTPMCDIRYANSYRNIQYPDYESPYVSTVFAQPISSMFRSPDLFTQSLRKYPNEKSSAELIQRIINYTRTKNFGKKRCSKSLRSLIRKSRSQTLAREDTGVTEECFGTVNQTFSTTKGRDLSQNELVNYTYDYLKCSSLVPRHTDVRYFTEVKRAIRGRLRDIICDKPTICPCIQSRYCRHRQRYHTKSASSVKNIEIQGASKDTTAPKDTSGPTVVRHTASSNIINCQSGCKPCFCNRLLPCDDEVFDRHEPVQNLLSNVHPEHNPSDEMTSQAHLPDGNSSGKETFENVINEWLKTIPIEYNFKAKEKSKREQQINELIKTLKKLQKHSNFPELAKKEIMICLDILPMWRPDDSENDVISKDKIADDLIKKIINFAEANFKTAISEEVKGLPFDVNKIHDIFIKKTIDKFIDKLTHVSLNRPPKDEDYKEKLKLEVISLLKDLPLRSDNQKGDQILKLADKFVERIFQYNIYENNSKQTVVDIETDEMEKKIYDWCTNIPEFYTHKYNKDRYSDLVKFLAKKFHKYQSKDTKNSSVQRKLQEEVKQWLDQLTTKLNTKLTSDRINILSKELIETIFGLDNISLIVNSLNEDSTSSKSLQYIAEWFLNISELSAGDNDDITEKFKELYFQLKFILNRNDNFENILADMKETISKWLKNMLNIKGLRLDSKDQDNLVNDLILKFTEKLDREKEGSENIKLYKDAITWLKEVPFTKPYDYEERNNLAGEFVVRLMDIEKTSNEDTIKTNIEEEIENFVNKLTGNDDKNITPEDIEKLKLKVFTQMKISPQRRKLWNKRNNNLRKILFKEISNIVDSYHLLPEKIKSSLKHKIINVILRNITNNTLEVEKTLSQVFDILKQDTALTNNDIEMLGRKIIDKVSDVLLRHESLHISPISAELTKLKLSNETNKTLETSSVETDMVITRDHHDLTSSQNSKLNNQHLPSQYINSNKNNNLNLDWRYESNLESETRNASENIRDTKQNPSSPTVRNNDTQTDHLKNNNTNFEDRDDVSKKSGNYNKKENLFIGEVSSHDISIIKNIDKAAKLFDKKIEERKTMNKSQIKTASRSGQDSVQTEPKTDKGINTSFINKEFSTSTPLTSTIKYPSVMLLPSLNNSFVTKTNDVEMDTSELLQYLNKLIEIITNWLHIFPLNLSEHDKYELINNIAYDILDRQKYIQLSDVSTSDKDELEHLKYQIYKRIHKLGIDEVIRNIIYDVDCLHHRILTLKVPKLIHPTHKHKLQQAIEIDQSNQDTVPTNIKTSRIKIDEWFKEFFPNFIDTLDDEMIQQLARNLENLKSNNNYDNCHIRQEIFQWISSVLNNIDIKKLCDLAESLKKYLCDTNLKETFILKQDTSEFVTENLSGAIIEWIRTSQYRYKLQNEIQDYFAMVLANDIKYVFAQSLSDDELNRVLVQEIMRDLAKVTGEVNYSAFHYAIACDLIQFLKELKLFRDLSDRETIGEGKEKKINYDSVYKDDIKEAVISWFNMLPLQENVPIQDIKYLVTSFIETINNSELGDILNNESVLKNHIRKLLGKIPLRIDRQDTDVQVVSLAAKIRNVLGQKQPVINKITRDFELQVDINQEETPSAIYKQLLHDTVSKTFLDKLTLEEQMSFNIMKEKLADAFIDLHFSTEDKEIRNEFKNKLYSAISKFCDDYLKHRPISPLHTDRLQEDLHNLLKNVSLPTIEPKTNVFRHNQEDEKQTQTSDLFKIETERENKTVDRKDAWTQSTSQVSPTSLSYEDIEHLQRIRTRSEIRSKGESFEKILPNKDSPSKHHVDIGIQTTVIVNEKISKSVQTSNASLTEHLPIHREISPQVIIREYYWDSNGSSQSFKITEPSIVLPQKEIPQETKVTTKTQTEPISNNGKQYPKQISKTQILHKSGVEEISVTKDIETQTEDLQQNVTNRSRYKQKSNIFDETYESQKNISSENQQNEIDDTTKTLSRRREGIDEGTDIIIEKETIHHIDCLNNDRRKLKLPKATTISENLSPIIITEKRSERRVYATPEYINTHNDKGGKICCNCKNHLLTQCRNKPYTGCRQLPTKNTLRHCSKCFGGYCPHPSNFFFKKDF
ncbi:unnamed protein product [Euphydryas editha]|uniref:Uncharacterized protein n=1 Tax=Euphydryas editha TaxID=104508 RepID=A0AAU9TBV5_EUPED|nr:unnamed protein product [Euphydryas editha]